MAEISKCLCCQETINLETEVFRNYEGFPCCCKCGNELPEEGD